MQPIPSFGAAPHLSLGAALYYDVDLSVDAAPLHTMWRALTKDLPESNLFQWTGTAARVSKRQRFDLAMLNATVVSGSAASAAIESEHGTLVLSHALPAAQLPEPLVPRPWRYDTAIAIAANDLVHVGAQRAVHAIVAFADAVNVKAGIIYWAESVAYASALATGGISTRLTDDQERHARSSHDLSNHWGRIIRGPAWGTFLNREQVAALEDLSRLQPATVTPLRAGGAYVQLPQVTSIDEPSPSPSLDRLREQLVPVSRR